MHVTFRVREPRPFLVVSAGVLLGLGAGALVWKLAGWQAALPFPPLGAVAGWILAGALARDRCVEPGCGAVLRHGVRHCPQCGSAVIGELAADGHVDEE